MQLRVGALGRASIAASPSVLEPNSMQLAHAAPNAVHAAPNARAGAS
jgi:hypothetical protein